MFVMWRLPLLFLPVLGLFAQGVFRTGAVHRFSEEVLSPEMRSQRDALRMDPVHYGLEFANQSIRVLRLKLSPVEEDLMHYAEDALAVCLDQCDIELRQPDGSTAVIHLKTGQTHWIRAGMRSEKNAGSQPFEILFIEKSGASGQ